MKHYTSSILHVSMLPSMTVKLHDWTTKMATFKTTGNMWQKKKIKKINHFFFSLKVLKWAVFYRKWPTINENADVLFLCELVYMTGVNNHMGCLMPVCSSEQWCQFQSSVKGNNVIYVYMYPINVSSHILNTYLIDPYYKIVDLKSLWNQNGQFLEYI